MTDKLKLQDINNNWRIGEIKDWRIGFITREVEKIEEDKYIINDMSCGWLQAEVNVSSSPMPQPL